MFNNKITLKQQKLFNYWELLQDINDLLVKCSGYKISFPLEELDKLDTSYDSYYDVIIEKARNLPKSEYNPSIKVHESLHSILGTQDGFGEKFSWFKQNFDEAMRRINFFNSYNLYKSSNDGYGFFELQNRINYILYKILVGFHMQYINGTPELIEFDQDIIEWTSIIPSKSSINNIIEKNKGNITNRGKVSYDNYYLSADEDIDLEDESWEHVIEYMDKHD